MLVAVDETGFFRDSVGEKMGIVTLVTITDSAWKKFSTFLDTTFPLGWVNIKGNNIKNSDRRKILTYIGSHTEIRYTSIVFDLSNGSDEWIKKHQDLSIEKMEASVEKIKNQLKPTYIKDIELLRNQIKSLAIGEYAKFVFITELFIEWQRYFSLIMYIQIFKMMVGNYIMLLICK